MSNLTWKKINAALDEIGDTGEAKVTGHDLLTRREENCDWRRIGSLATAPDLDMDTDDDEYQPEPHLVETHIEAYFAR